MLRAGPAEAHQQPADSGGQAYAEGQADAGQGDSLRAGVRRRLLLREVLQAADGDAAFGVQGNGAKESLSCRAHLDL